MRAFKIICSILLIAALVITVVFCYQTSNRQDLSGGYSAVSTITEKSSQWLLEKFGHCESVVELLLEIDRFGCETFVYESQVYPFIVQSFDLDKFIFEDNFHGMCFEFSSFVKCAVLVWKEARHRDDVQAYVYDVKKGSDWRHSYNFIMEDGRTWFFCLTSNNTLVKTGKASHGVTLLAAETPEEYTNRYGEIITDIH